MTQNSPSIRTKDIKRALTINWEIIQNNKVLISQFPKKPTIAYRRNTNLKDKLVRAKINTENNKREMNEQTNTQQQKTKGSEHQTNKQLYTFDKHSYTQSRDQIDPDVLLLASLLEEQN